MPFAVYRIFENGRIISGDRAQASALGEAKVLVLPTTSVLRVEWAPAEQPSRDGLPYVKLYALSSGVDLVEDTNRRLANLGFSRRASGADNVRDYQRAVGQGGTGELADVVQRVRADHDLGQLAGFSEIAVADAPASAPASWTAFATQPQKWAGAFGIDAWPPKLAPTAVRSFTDDGGGASQGPSPQGAVVPEVGDVLVYVSAKDWAFPIGLKGTTIELVPSAGGQNRRTSLAPGEAGGWALIYCFRDVPLGDYGIAVYIDNAATQDKRHVPAMGSTRIGVGLGVLTLGYVPLELDRPIMTVDDPLLDLNHDMMQRRRKVLATVFQYFPVSMAPSAEKQGVRPPYNQGNYKHNELANVSSRGQWNCAPVNAAIMQLASKAGHLYGFNIPRTPGFVPYAIGRVPSVGDSVYYALSKDGGADHCGVVLESAGDGGTWICADGGQPDRTSEYKRIGKTWARYYLTDGMPVSDEYPVSFEGAYILPRYFYEPSNEPKREEGATTVNGFLFPDSVTRKSLPLLGWKNIGDPQVAFPKSAYGPEGNASSYRRCVELVRSLRGAIAADQEACRAVRKAAGD